MSSIHGNGTQLVKRIGDNNNITKPNIIVEYNKYMNGVDKCNQYLNYYSLGRKAKKWWKKVFYRTVYYQCYGAVFCRSSRFSLKSFKHTSYFEFNLFMIFCNLCWIHKFQWQKRFTHKFPIGDQEVMRSTIEMRSYYSDKFESM